MSSWEQTGGTIVQGTEKRDNRSGGIRPENRWEGHSSREKEGRGLVRGTGERSACPGSRIEGLNRRGNSSRKKKEGELI
jgi:hypothetical protein